MLLGPHSHTVRTGHAGEPCWHLGTVLSCPCHQPHPLSSWDELLPRPWATHRVTSPPVPVALTRSTQLTTALRWLLLLSDVIAPRCRALGWDQVKPWRCLMPTIWEEKSSRWSLTSVLLQALLLAGAGNCRVLLSVPCPKPSHRTPEQAGNILYRHSGAGGFGLGTTWGCH